MAERKDTNPFTSEEPNPHLPPNIYQPNPFPINPTEGNPWAAQNNQPYQQQPYQQPPQYQGHTHTDNNSSSTYGHSYNNTSSDGSQSNYTMNMPNPSAYVNSSYNYSNDSNAYNNNAYNAPENAYSSNFNAYEHSSKTPQVENNIVKEEQNYTELDESASNANPGIESYDPDKLNITSQIVKDLNGTPNNWRLLSRFIQFLASVGAFAFIVGAFPVSRDQIPDEANKIAIIFLYIVSSVSIIYSFGHLVLYCLRRWKSKSKAPRWSLILIDVIIGASFGTLMVFLIKDYSCKPGSFRWCDFYNTSIFFTVLAFVTYAISFTWDIIGGCKRS